MIIFRELPTGEFELDRESLNTIITPNGIIEKIAQSNEHIFTSVDNKKGANAKFWINNANISDKDLLLFKTSINDPAKGKRASYYGELVVDLICHFTGFPHTSYYPCKVIKVDGTELEGTLSPNYKDKDCDLEFSVDNIKSRFEKYMYDNNNGMVPPIPLNTVYGYIAQIDIMYGQFMQPGKLEEIKNYLLMLALLDFVTMQIDRHGGNICMQFDSKKGIGSSIQYIPAFDSECICGFDDDLIKVLQRARDYKARTATGSTAPFEKTAASKKQAPLLGIRTSIVELTSNGMMVSRKYKDGESSNIEIITKELVDELLINPELMDFYKKLKNLKLQELMESLGGYFPEEIIYLATNLFEYRIKMLEQELKKRGYKNEEDDQDDRDIR